MKKKSVEKEIFKRIGKDVKPTKPSVSVIIPCYNSAAFISETLDSVFNQTFSDYEVIIINDGSPDTLEFENALEKYREKIIYLKQENGGVSKARNEGINEARGKLAAFLDSDDIWYPNFLKSQIEFLQKNNLDLVYCDALLFGISSLNGKTYMKHSPSDGEVSLGSLLSFKCNIITSCTIADKEIIKRAGGFDEGIAVSEDFDLWINCAYQGARIGYQKKVLAKHRIRHDSLSGNNLQKIEMVVNELRHVKEKLVLNSLDKATIDEQIERLQSQWYLEKGKQYLLKKEFDKAEKNFKTAYRSLKTLKLRIVIIMMNFSPMLLNRLFTSLQKKDLPVFSDNH